MRIKELIIYPSNICNLKCKMCYIHQEDPQSLNSDDLQWIRDTFEPKKTIILGGEPLMYDKLEDIFKLFPDTSMQISTNATLVKKNIDLLDKYNVSSQLSVEGGQKETDYLRAEGIWDTVMDSAKLMNEHNLKHYIRVSYHLNNLNHMEEVFDAAEKVDSQVILFPRVDLPPISTTLQRELFDMALDRKGIVAQPNFLQYIGKKGRCGAGSERLNVFYDKRITPCNLDLDYTLGRIGDSVDRIKRNIKNYLENFKITPVECVGCKHADVCKGSCYVAKSYLGCPLRYNIDYGNYIERKNLNAEKIQNQVNTATDFIKSVIVC